MTDDSKHSDNNSTSDVLGAAVRRRPGRPKGMPKPPGSGRQPGTRNRVGKEARELAGKYTEKAFKRLGELAQHPDPKVAVLAIQQILDRRFGKPVSPQEIAGPGGTPLIPVPEMSDLEVARRISFMLSRAAREKLGPSAPLPKTVDGINRVVAGEDWSPDEPAEVEARELYEAKYRLGCHPAALPKPVDPFADQRAEQAERIAAATAQPEGDTKLSDYATAAAAQRAERDAARAEGRLERPVPVWVDENRLPRAGEDFSPATANVTRFRPRTR